MDNKKQGVELVIADVSYLGCKIGVGKQSNKEYGQKFFIDKEYNKFSMFVELTPEFRKEASEMDPIVTKGKLIVTPSVSRNGSLELRFVRFEAGK